MNTVAAALNSRRFIRLLPWLGGLVLIAGVVAFMIAYFGNTSTVAKNVPQANDPTAAQFSSATRKNVPLDPQVKLLANEFMHTAVARKNPVRAFQLSGPDIRQGATLAEWKRDWQNPNVGIAVVPYPIDEVQASPFRIDYSYRNEALLEVALLPKPGSKIKGQIFYIGLKRFGKGAHRQWLVNYWAPHNIIPVPSQ